MGSSVSVAYRFRPEGRAWASPFFRELAGLLVEFDPGSSVLLEYGLDDPRPWIIPSRDGIGPAISAAAAAVPGSLERRSPVPAWPIVRTETLTWAILGPDSRSGVRSPSRPTPAPFLLSDLPGLPPFPDTVGGPAAPPGVYAPIVRVLWSARADGLLDVRWETLLGYGPEDPGVGLWLAVLKRELRRAGFPPCAVIRQRSFANVPRPWQNGSFHWAGSRFAFVVSPATAAAGVLATLPAGSVEAIPLDRHVISIGATGSGKTELLVRLAAAAMADGFRVVALDVHGDLAPRIVAALDPGRRERLLAIDPTVPGGTVGIDLLHYSEPSDRERLAGQIVAILRRLSSENGDLYWGFRLERIFDVFVRLALEEQGTLLDIYGLLTDERRREASRLHTQDPAIGRFLDELPGILRRNPEFLWPAASRLSKIVHDPRLGALLAPRSVGLDPEGQEMRTRSIVVRLPLGEFGPEGAGFAASLIAGRLYHARARAADAAGRDPPTLFLLDEAHLFSPRFLLDLLTEGRKFGLAGALATQYPERLVPELRSAAEASAGTHVVFRVPHVSTVAASRWSGLAPEEADRLLPALPPGVAIVSLSGEAAVRFAVHLPRPPALDLELWRTCTQRTAQELAPMDSEGTAGTDAESAIERVLLDSYAAEESGRPLSVSQGRPAQILSAHRASPMEAESSGPLELLMRRGYLSSEDGSLRLTAAGHRFLGLGQPTGAVQESGLHRALIFTAVRLFALHGARLEVVRQGRFDTRLPDGVYRQLGDPRPTAPGQLAEELDRARRSWAWRLFHGRDVFVEVEVSGALRADRVRRGLAKGAREEAFVLFIVPDSPRAVRVRRVLLAERARWPHARVWVLRPPPHGPGDAPAPEALSRSES